MNKETINNWKDKAITRMKLLKSTKKELKRQKERADKWRVEALVLREQIRNKDLIINKLDSFSGSLVSDSAITPTTERLKLKGYKYDIKLISLCINLYKCGLSLRSICSVLCFMGIYLGVKIKIPSYGIISVWVQKSGLHLLKTGAERFKNTAEQWSLIIDESYTLGKSRLLVILAVRLSKLQVGRLKTTDVVPIVIKSQESWKSEDVTICINQAVLQFKGNIAYVTSDQGTNLVCSCKATNLAHLPDWSHTAANILENIYTKEPDFKEFNEKIGIFKRKRKQSIYTHYSPPNLSVKVRFMNYLPFLEWANIMIKNFKKIPIEIVPELMFLQTLKTSIQEMSELFYMADTIGKILKTEGISKITRTKVTTKIETLTKKYPNNQRVATFIDRINDYFTQTMPIYYDYIKRQDKDAPFFNGLVASSDVIECIFGKVKHRAPKNPKIGFSSSSLLIPLFCQDFSNEDIFDAMNNINCETLELWKTENICSRKYISFKNIFKQKKGKVCN